MMIAWKGLPRAEEYREVFLILGREGVIGPDLAQRLAGAAGVRNILVHQYGRVDRRRLLRIVQQDLGDLEAFGAAVASWLEP